MTFSLLLPRTASIAKFHSYHLSHSLRRRVLHIMPSNRSQTEIVDDSEPEREELRRKLRLEKKQKRTVSVEPPVVVDIDSMVLTDESSVSLRTVEPQAEISVIEISGTSPKVALFRVTF